MMLQGSGTFEQRWQLDSMAQHEQVIFLLLKLLDIGCIGSNTGSASVLDTLWFHPRPNLFTSLP